MQQSYIIYKIYRDNATACMEHLRWQAAVLVSTFKNMHTRTAGTLHVCVILSTQSTRALA